MLLTLLPSLCLFGLVIAITPGPNNFLLASSGSQFGIKRTMGHILGIRVGICLLILLSAAGIGLLIQQYPVAYKALKYVGVAYMSYLAIKLLLAGGNLKKRQASEPINWRQAALFQLVNVKAWAACISVVASYAIASDYWLSVVWIIIAFTSTGLFANSCWACLGHGARLYLDTPNKVRAFNYLLSAITFATILPILFQNN